MPTSPPPILTQMTVLGDAVRCRALRVLERRELTVAELCAVLQLPQSTASRHLKLLADEGWVVHRREGTATIYRLMLDDLDPPAVEVLEREARHALGTAARGREPNGRDEPAHERLGAVGRASAGPPDGPRPGPPLLAPLPPAAPAPGPGDAIRRMAPPGASRVATSGLVSSFARIALPLSTAPVAMAKFSKRSVAVACSGAWGQKLPTIIPTTSPIASQTNCFCLKV